MSYKESLAAIARVTAPEPVAIERQAKPRKQPVQASQR